MPTIPPDIQYLLDWANKADTWKLYAHRLEYIVDRLLIDLDIEQGSAEHYYSGFERLLRQRAKDKFADL